MNFLFMKWNFHEIFDVVIYITKNELKFNHLHYLFYKFD